MPTHYWGDKDFDWKGLQEAIDYIHEYCVKYGSIEIFSKEKWGNADIYAGFWTGSILELLYARQWHWTIRKSPDWLRDIDFKFADLMSFLKITNLVHKYQHYIYRKAYDNALTKWPSLKKEIVGGMAHWELLESVMVKHDLTCEYKDDACHKKQHIFNADGYCIKCFIKIGVIEKDEDEN